MRSWLLLLVMLTGCSAAGATAPLTLNATTAKPGDSVAVSVAGSAATVTILSKSGIGSATVELTSAQRPARLVLRLPLRGLESVKLSYGATTTIGGRSASGETRPRVSVVGGPQEETIRAEDPRAVRVEATDGGFAVEVPQDFLRGTETRLNVEWVDFYR